MAQMRVFVHIMDNGGSICMYTRVSQSALCLYPYIYARRGTADPVKYAT